MKHRFARTAALAIAGTTILTSATAIADPAMTFVVGGAPYVDGQSGELGQAVSMTGTGCLAPDPEVPTYMGEFASQTQDPALGPIELVHELPADATGAIQWDVVLNVEASGTWYARWYCSDTPGGNIYDSSMLWIGPLTTFTIGGAQANAVGARSLADTSSGAGVTVDVDPDALPLVDRMGIPGDVAAKLKARVDERYEDVARIQRMYGVFFGRPADRSGLDFWVRQLATKSARTVAAGMANSSEFTRGYGSLSDDDFVAKLYENTLGRSGDRAGRSFWGNRLSSQRQSRTDIALAFADSSEYARRTASANYVVAAFQTLTGRTPTPTQIATHVEHLDNGGIKVQLVEDIALTAHDADWWASQG